MRRFKITIEGVSYEVTVEELESEGPVRESPDDLAGVVADAATGLPPPEVSAPQATPAVQTEPGDVMSPLSGTVTHVSVAVGDKVKKGDTLLQLEAMKMESSVLAPCDGQVAKIRVSVGQQVQEGQMLLAID